MRSTDAIKRTALYAEHLKRGAKITDFHGWEMPLYYTSILEEHASVRTASGLFDISHMGQVWVSGPSALECLNALVVSDLTQVAEGRACYSLLTNEQAGILDDVIIYRVGAFDYLVIVNCANREKDYGWLQAHPRESVELRDISAGRSIIAVQGPKSAEVLERTLEINLRGLARFSVMALPSLGKRTWIARTGYTGSDGFEFFLPDASAVTLWKRLLEVGKSHGLAPVGLGARDTLRLEAGLRLYGTDMDETTTPYEAGLGWTVAIHKAASFLGQTVLVQQQSRGVSRCVVGFALEEGPVPRTGFPLFAEGRGIGAVTSGTFSPMLNKPIGMGSVETAWTKPGTAISVGIRGKQHPATVVKLPFWRPDQPVAKSPSEKVAV
ncbi:MAG: glycine cleavage system aminomethyltransferase GcvT [Candidatus Omnitrophica bacterium]|nr:glycine cleavage system aminomethyltransferase GcvT [Candidatus Omnitrophota bacterium]